MLALKTEPFLACLHLGQCCSLAGARCAEGTLCCIRHSISPAVPLSLTLEEPSWVAGLPDCTRLCSGPSPSGTALYQDYVMPWAIGCCADRRVSVGLPAAPVILVIHLIKVNSKDGHFLFILVLGVWEVFFLSKFSLNFPTDLPRVHIFLHFQARLIMQCLTGTQNRGKVGAKVRKCGLNAQHTQLLCTGASDRGGNRAAQLE